MNSTNDVKPTNNVANVIFVPSSNIPVKNNKIDSIIFVENSAAKEILALVLGVVKFFEYLSEST